MFASGCGSGGSAPSSVTGSVGGVVGGSPSRFIYVVDGGIGNVNPSISKFPENANGNVAPAAIIAGANTGLNEPYGVALDVSGNLWVTNSGNSTITEYAAGASGNVKPLTTISGTSTGLNLPLGLAFDPAGHLFVANGMGGPNGTGTITEYAAGATGDVAPIATIVGSHTGLVRPVSVAIQNNIIFTSQGVSNGSITQYVVGQSGDVAPQKTIEGNATLLNFPSCITLDGAGNIYVGNQAGTIAPSVSEYAPTATGNAVPIRTITGTSTGISNPSCVALDSTGTIYVADANALSLIEFATNATGNTAPKSVIQGTSTGLAFPLGIAVTQ